MLLGFWSCWKAWIFPASHSPSGFQENAAPGMECVQTTEALKLVSQNFQITCGAQVMNVWTLYSDSCDAVCWSFVALPQPAPFEPQDSALSMFACWSLPITHTLFLVAWTSPRTPSRVIKTPHRKTCPAPSGSLGEVLRKPEEPSLGCSPSHSRSASF